MDNNKKQQNYSAAGNSKNSNPSDWNGQKSSSDIQNNKHWPKNSRRRENPTSSTRNNNNNNKQQHLASKVCPNVDKRPRGRGYNNQHSGRSHQTAYDDYFTASAGLVSSDKAFYSSLEAERYGHTELTSVHFPGSKKQNINHMLNFYCTPRERDFYDGFGENYVGHNANNQRHSHAKKQRYNKEQFLQANFQFVIKSSAKRKTDDSPDTLIDWSLIEQINIQTPDELQCPICLYPPVAAKITRCGHVYCWSCVLHYLSLSDKAWRKCPICYDSVYVDDLKSASIVQLQYFKDNAQITFRLMRRKNGSSLIETYDNRKAERTVQKYPYVGSPIEEKLFSKFILAKRNDVADILAREERELLTDVDETRPEYIFILQALDLLKQRAEKLGEIEQKEDNGHKFEEIVENVSNNGSDSSVIEDTEQSFNNDNISLIEDTDQILNNDMKGNEVLQDVANCSPNNIQQNDFEEECLESSKTELIKKLSTKYYYFYQSDDGQNIYLHPLNVKMLQANYNGLADAPSVISGKIIQREQLSMDEEHRRKFKCLGHLPLTCEFAVVEIELQPPYVTEDTIRIFHSDILFRKKERQRKAFEERKREKHINEINERQMGKIIASTANINLTSSHEFPMCGFEEPLVQTVETEVMDNLPSTSKGCRTKTISTGSAGSCSYSAIASHCKKEHTPWSTVNAAQAAKSSSSSSVVQAENGDGETSILSTKPTNFGDVLAEALSQKKDKKSPTGSVETTSSNMNKSTKKSKKCKKMLPLYSTGMNFSS